MIAQLIYGQFNFTGYQCGILTNYLCQVLCPLILQTPSLLAF